MFEHHPLVSQSNIDAPKYWSIPTPPKKWMALVEVLFFVKPWALGEKQADHDHDPELVKGPKIPLNKSGHAHILQKCNFDNPHIAGLRHDFRRSVRISREGLGEIRLRDNDLSKIEALARNNPEHYFFFELMFRRGFRVSAITGDKARRVRYTKQVKVKRSDGTIQLIDEKITKNYPAGQGIRKEDVTPEGVSVVWKGGERNFRYLPNDLAKELYSYALTLRKNQKVVGFTRQRGYQLCQEYAKRAGIIDWKRVHPHRFRHYFGTFHARRTGRDPWKVSSLMGHKDLRATRVYVEELSPEEEKAELG